MTDITLQQIEIFLTVAEELNLSAAAKGLFLNQSAVSRWIQRLEGSLITKLFIRNNRGVTLTPDGEFLYAELKPIFNGLSSTLRSMRALYSMPENIIRVGCINDDEVIGTLKIFADGFAEDHPDVVMKVVPSNFKDIQEALVLGIVDCSITYQLGFGEIMHSRVKKIKRLNSFFAISSRHPLADSGSLDAPQLSDETLFLLTLPEMKSSEERAIELCRDNGFTPTRITYLPTILSIENAVRDMRGFTINGRNFGQRYKNEIKLFEIKNVKTPQHIIMAWREGICTALTRQFIDTIPEIED